MTTLITVQDVIMPKSGNKKVNLDVVLPFIVLPILFLIATISRTVTLIIMVVIAMTALYGQSKPHQKNRLQFFYSWTLSSAVYLFLIFEIGVLELLEITLMEHIIFLLLLIMTSYFFYKTKTIADFELAMGSSKGKEYRPVLTADSYYCKVCQIEVNERFFHSIWWDCCVLRPNYLYYFAGQLCAFLTFLIGINLSLTSICQPYVFYDPILMPGDCSDVYDEFNSAICFVASVYGIGYLFIITLILLQQLIIYIPKYSEPQWKKLINVLNV